MQFQRETGDKMNEHDICPKCGDSICICMGAEKVGKPYSIIFQEWKNYCTCWNCKIGWKHNVVRYIWYDWDKDKVSLLKWIALVIPAVIWFGVLTYTIIRM